MKYKGCEGVVIINGLTIVELSAFSIDQSANPVDSSVLGNSGFKEVKPGQSSWSGTIDVFYDPDDSGILAMVLNTIVAVQMYPAGSDTGKTEYSGNALVTSISTPVETEGVISQSISIEGTGQFQTSILTTSARIKKEHSKS